MSATVQENTRYDSGERRQAVRHGRERGVWVYVPAEALRAAGIDPHDAAPFYRTWGTARGGVFVRLYKRRRPE